MREILFRGKRKDNGEWVEGYLYIRYFQELPHDRFVIEHKPKYNHEMWQPQYMVSEIDPETIGQYIGLTDKNGKKIFERDIVIFNRGRNLPNTIPRPLIIFFDERNAQFTIYENPFATLQKDMMPECEVIGNIHDNPELLKELENEQSL